LEFNVPFQHKYGYIRDECIVVTVYADLFLSLDRLSNKLLLSTAVYIVPYDKRESCGREQVQEMQNMATKQDAETIKSKEDCNILRTTITDIRDKINKMEMKVLSSLRSTLSSCYRGT